ncbi:MAG TPA: hypothetical protein VHY18_10800 [Solirubrobacteraceae bacterium]|nr:hypothetical protein [Solirubrobacteraceae bacterium]
MASSGRANQALAQLHSNGRRQPLAIEAKHLKMAQELAEDAAPVYATADETIKHGYNQEFFTKL